MISADETEGIKSILRNVLLEMFCSKLGTTINIDLTEREIAVIAATANWEDGLNGEIKAKVRKVVTAHCSKTDGMHAHSIIFHDRARCPRYINLVRANT